MAIPGRGGKANTGSISPRMLRKDSAVSGAVAEELSGSIRKAEVPSLADGRPIGTIRKLTPEANITVPASYEKEGEVSSPVAKTSIVSQVLSGLGSVMPIFLVVGSIVIGAVIISKAGKKGR